MTTRIDVRDYTLLVDIEVTQHARSATFYDPGEGAYFEVVAVYKEGSRRDVWPRIKGALREEIESHPALQDAANYEVDDAYERYLEDCAEGREGLVWV